MKKSLSILAVVVLFLIPSMTNAKEYCREYNTVIKIDGRNEKAYGVSCRQPDGTWKLKSNELFIEEPATTVYRTTPVVYSNTVYIRDTYPVYAPSTRVFVGYKRPIHWGHTGHTGHRGHMGYRPKHAGIYSGGYYTVIPTHPRRVYIP